MDKFDIYVNNILIATISGYEAAWETYCKAEELNESIGIGYAYLINHNTGEIIADSTGYRN